MKSTRYEWLCFGSRFQPFFGGVARDVMFMFSSEAPFEVGAKMAPAAGARAVAESGD